MKKLSLVASVGLLSSTTLVGCSSTHPTIEIENYLTYGYSDETKDTGLYLVPEEYLVNCGSWSPYNKVFKDEKVYDEVYYCTGKKDEKVFLYRGVTSFNLKTLVTSQYYLTKGEDKSEIFVTDGYKERNIIPSYFNGKYSIPLVEDPTIRFDESIEEENAEGSLITQSQLDNEQWRDSDDAEDVLISNNNSVLYAGVLFASMLALQNSSYYKSKGVDTSRIAVPSSVKNGKDSLGYSNGRYFSNNNIKSSKATTIPATNKANNPIGAVSLKKENQAGAAAVAGASSAMSKSTELTKGTSSNHNGNSNNSVNNSKGEASKGGTNSPPRGSGGISSGSKGGGAS